MSEGEWFGGFALASDCDGVTVEQGLDVSTLSLPAVRYRAESTREDPVRVLVTESLPAALDVPHVGVHADLDADAWLALDDRTVAWALTLDPGETRETLLGVWLTDTRQVDAFLHRPTIETVADPDAVDEWPPASDTDETVRPLADDAPTGGLVEDVVASLGGETDDDSSDDEVASDEPASEAATGDAEGAEGEPAASEAEAADAETAASDGRAAADEEPVALPGETTDVDAGADDPEEPDSSPALDSERTVRRGAGSCDPVQDGVLAEFDAPDAADGQRLAVAAHVADGRHGGGAPAVLQELQNAVAVGGRRVEGVGDDVDRLTALVATDQAPGTVADALAERPQVTDVAVTPVAPPPTDGGQCGEGAATTDADADAGAASPDDPAAAFAALQDEVEPVSPDELAAELEDVEFAGVDADAEVSMASLLARDEGATPGRTPRTRVGAVPRGDADAVDVDVGALQDAVARLRERVAELEAEKRPAYSER
jgi:hypothetical protein